ncbi:uncharacterized protein PRCAT00006355001 [Priceomyces carsonii]|uniref:uncharacterized protein n=1 Tax=Priceomyces carsonii TaxID=28549 RepID=UPI002ED9E00A|nr:unnamed protein product [Priceomyces carsonii]
MNDQITFQYANECELEIHCSPFGLSGLYIKISGTDVRGIGSTLGIITGSTRGRIHYNDSRDLINREYKLYVTVDPEDMLRIDFTKIILDSTGSGKFDTSNDKDDDEVPALIFMGKCPEGRPEKIQPFIGIFSFEGEDTSSGLNDSQ